MGERPAAVHWRLVGTVQAARRSPALLHECLLLEQLVSQLFLPVLLLHPLSLLPVLLLLSLLPVLLPLPLLPLLPVLLPLPLLPLLAKKVPATTPPCLVLKHHVGSAMAQVLHV